MSRSMCNSHNCRILIEPHLYQAFVLVTNLFEKNTLRETVVTWIWQRELDMYTTQTHKHMLHFFTQSIELTHNT